MLKKIVILNALSIRNKGLCLFLYLIKDVRNTQQKKLFLFTNNSFRSNHMFSYYYYYYYKGDYCSLYNPT